MQRYSRDRPIAYDSLCLCVRGDKRGNIIQDTAKIAVKANGANGLAGGAAEPEGQPGRNCRARPSEL